MKQYFLRLAGVTVSHFCVDCMCALLVWSCFLHIRFLPMAVLLIYHTIAFGLQPVIGSICDSHRKWNAAALGAGLTLCACLLAVVLPVPAVFLAGLGNAFFHVGGGYVSLHHGTDRLGPGGVFVAGGAMGIAAGALAGNSLPGVPLLLIGGGLLGAASLVLCLACANDREERERATRFTLVRPGLGIVPVLLVTVLSIVVRGYVGFTVPLDWKTAAWMALLTAGAAALGKGLGGVIADRLGPGFTGCCALLLAVPFLWFSGSMPLTLIGLFLINVPMSVTLAVLCRCLPKDTGLAFGLAPLGLFIAWLAAMCVSLPETAAKAVIAVMLILSAAMLKWSVKGSREQKPGLFP